MCVARRREMVIVHVPLLDATCDPATDPFGDHDRVNLVDTELTPERLTSTNLRLSNLGAPCRRPPRLGYLAPNLHFRRDEEEVTSSA